MTIQSFDSDTLTSLLYTPEAGGTADYDIELWGWASGSDPDFLLSIFTTSQIGVWSDSNYSNPAYDELYDQQKKAVDVPARKAIIDQMQDMIYDDAPYIILFYDNELHAYRSDRFEGWTLQPRDGGIALFATGVETYLNLAPVGSSASPSPDGNAASPAPGSSGPATSSDPNAPTDGGSSTSSTLPLLLGVAGLIAVVGVGLVLMRRGRSTATADEDDD